MSYTVYDVELRAEQYGGVNNVMHYKKHLKKYFVRLECVYDRWFGPTSNTGVQIHWSQALRAPLCNPLFMYLY